MVRRGVLAPEDVLDQLARLRLHLHGAEVQAGVAARAALARLELERGRGYLVVGEARYVPRGQRMAGHHRRLLREDRLDAARLQSREVQLAAVTPLPIWSRLPAVAERILAPGDEGDAALGPG